MTYMCTCTHCPTVAAGFFVQQETQFFLQLYKSQPLNWLGRKIPCTTTPPLSNQRILFI